MKLYDDKTRNVIKSGSKLLTAEIDSSEDVIFKASFVVSSDLHCTGKITALFNLIVYGNVYAEEIDVKGRFVCMGNCSVSGAIIVQDDLWCEDIRAKSIICHNRIMAQSIDADSILADGNIVVGKTLAIEDEAKTFQNIICGETAYGAGKIIASRILTTEPLDLDDGEEAIESPFQYAPNSNRFVDSKVALLSSKYEKTNNYSGYLRELAIIPDEYAQNRLHKYLQALRTVESVYPSKLSELKDISLLFCMVEISNSEYFSGWNIIKRWTEDLLEHFKSIAQRNVIGTEDPKPATKLEKDYIVLHFNYGKGVVRTINSAIVKGKPAYVAVIDFEASGEKKFPLPESLRFFTVLSESNKDISDKKGVAIQCNVSSYTEWVSYMYLVSRHREYLGTDLYEIAYGLLLAKLGLKSKYVENHFNN